MKYLFTLIFFVITIHYSNAQENGPYKAYYDSGELKSEGQFSNGKRIGKWKNYHKNGEVSRRYSYNSEGKRNKIYEAFYKDGMLSNKTEKVDGDYINFGYYKSGKLRYKRQISTGYYIGYFESGALKLEANYFESELVGAWKQYYENGQIQWLVTYKDGYRDGPYKHFYNNGDLKLEGTNSYDKINGIEKRYLPNNILEWQGNYTKGVLHKTWIKFDTVGQKVEKIKFKNGIVVNKEYRGVLLPTKMADGVFERVPLYPGCETLLTNKTRRDCMNRKVTMFVNENFNTDLGKVLPKGRKKIFINFEVQKTGDVEIVKVKAPNIQLRVEAIRVIKMLPKMKPGMQRGKPVIVPFSLPVVFQVN